MSDNAGQPQDKKIFVDEGWKAQVEAEKEAAKSKAEKPQAEGAAQRPKGPLPPPSLSLLASSLGMQAMIAMGLVPAPGAEKPEADLEEAKHVIGILDMLWQKTEGNRTPDETAMLDGLLHELRLGYLAVQERAKT
jgi:hypothetical protein